MADFKFKVGQRVDSGNFHGIITNNYRGEEGRKYCEYECCICGYHGSKREDHIEKGYGCTACDGKAVVKGLNDISTTAPWMVPYFQGGEAEASLYTKNSNKKIYPICPFCHRVSKNMVAIDHINCYKGIRCSCNDNISIPNKTIFSVMEQLYEIGEIQYFNNEFRFEDSNNPYDMYFEKDNLKYIVEMDGGIGHGHKPTIDKRTPEEAIATDRKKDTIAMTHGCCVVRIDSVKSDLDFLKKNIYDSILNGIVDLSKVDWIRVFEFTCSNLVKDVCDYKKNHPDEFVPQISKKFHLSKSTIERYLHRGNKLGWCDYDGKEDFNKYRLFNTVVTSRQNCISVKNLTTGEEDCYSSVSELERTSKEKYGRKFSGYIIKKYMDDNPYYYDGYYFKRITKDYYTEWAKSNNIGKNIV